MASKNEIANSLKKEVDLINNVKYFGKITSVKGLLAECSGLNKIASIGSRCKIQTQNQSDILCEVVGFKDNKIMLMPFKDLEGVSMNSKVWLLENDFSIYPSDEWLGRVVNSLGEAIDKKGQIAKGNKRYSLKSSPPPAHSRNRLTEKLDTGVKSINAFLTCCKGQRMGVFAGSGVGKSVLLSMLTKYSDADVKIIGLIGERGREVQEFLQEYLGEEGLKKSIVVVATSDESALMRRQATYLTITLAEYFRDIGKSVLCLMDSVTRFAMAQREIGLSAGEPPTTKGYTPTVFSLLPKLLERAGPGINKGTITAFFTVLVDGDDHNEPISDSVRGILDGHIVLERQIAERGRFPAINIMKSVSRTMPGCNSDEQNEVIYKARNILSTYDSMSELIRLGAYKIGSDPKIDEAIKYNDKLEEFLKQKPNEQRSLEECYNDLKSILKVK